MFKLLFLKAGLGFPVLSSKKGSHKINSNLTKKYPSRSPPSSAYKLLDFIVKFTYVKDILYTLFSCS